MAATDLAQGRVVCAGRYRLQRRLGAGGMAVVWQAVDEHLGRPVAVKMLSDTLAGDASYVTRFRREARVAAQLSHPRLVQIYDFGDQDGRPFLVMELVNGPTLAQLLGQEGGLRLDVPQLADDLLQALAHVHDAGIVHRDVKPANVLIGPERRAQLTDFGVARPPDATELTGTGLVIGTLRYLAPEVAAGHPATTRSDLFALGRALREVADCANSDCGPQLSGLIGQLVREDPDERPASAREALALLDGAPPTAVNIPRRPRRPRAARAPAARRPASAIKPPRAARASGPLWRGASKSEIWILAPLAALFVAAVVIVLIGLADSTGSSRTVPRPAAPSAPLARQLEAIGRALDSTGR